MQQVSGFVYSTLSCTGTANFLPGHLHRRLQATVAGGVRTHQRSREGAIQRNHRPKRSFWRAHLALHALEVCSQIVRNLGPDIRFDQEILLFIVCTCLDDRFSVCPLHRVSVAHPPSKIQQIWQRCSLQKAARSLSAKVLVKEETKIKT